MAGRAAGRGPAHRTTATSAGRPRFAASDTMVALCLAVVAAPLFWLIGPAPNPTPTDAAALTGGQHLFNANCAPCHGVGGSGAPGYPVLTDRDWLWGGTEQAIAETIRYGVRAAHDHTRLSAMPRFGADGVLSRADIAATADYVLWLGGRPAGADRVARGRALFLDHCAECHGSDGGGNPAVGAPALNDHVWLYGGDRATIVETIAYARRGVMPSWELRLPDETIARLAAYVHALGGGQ